MLQSSSHGGLELLYCTQVRNNSPSSLMFLGGVSLETPLGHFLILWITISSERMVFVFLFPPLLHLFSCPNSLSWWIMALFFPCCLSSCTCSFKDNQPGVFLLPKAILKLRSQLRMPFLGGLVRFNLQKMNDHVHVRSKVI